MRTISLAVLIALFGIRAEAEELFFNRRVIIPETSGTAYSIHADKWRVYVALTGSNAGGSVAFGNGQYSHANRIVVLDGSNVGRSVDTGAFTIFPSTAIAGSNEWLYTISKVGWVSIFHKGIPVTSNQLVNSNLSDIRDDWNALLIDRGTDPRTDPEPYVAIIGNALAESDGELFASVLPNPDDDMHAYLAANSHSVIVSTGAQRPVIFRIRNNITGFFALPERSKTSIFSKAGTQMSELSNSSLGCTPFVHANDRYIVRSCAPPVITGPGILVTKTNSLTDESTKRIEAFGATAVKIVTFRNVDYIIFATAGGRLGILRADGENYTNIHSVDLYDTVSDNGGRTDPTNYYGEWADGGIRNYFGTDMIPYAVDAVTHEDELRIYVLTRPRHRVRRTFPPLLFQFTLKP